MYSIKDIQKSQSQANQAGFNEHGVPLHACNGYRHDEHYWAWIRFKYIK